MKLNPARLQKYQPALIAQLKELEQVTFVSGPAGCGKSTKIPGIMANIFLERDKAHMKE